MHLTCQLPCSDTGAREVDVSDQSEATGTRAHSASDHVLNLIFEKLWHYLKLATSAVDTGHSPILSQREE